MGLPIGAGRPLAALLAVVVTSALATPNAATAEDEYYELMKVFVDTFEQIDRNYVKDVDKRELVDAAVRGMLVELDPYSNYISPDELSNFTEDIEQEFGGIGVNVNYDPRTKSLIVMAPLPGSPAFRVGLRTGDRIVEVNGEKLADFPPGREQVEALKRLRGPAGEPVEVGVFRVIKVEGDAGNVGEVGEANESAGPPEPSDESDDAESTADSDDEPPAEVADGDEDLLRFQIVRDNIQLPTVFGYLRGREGDDDWRYILPTEGGGPRIAYIRIASFTRRTPEELRTALRKIEERSGEAIVIDLRDNPGGLLTAAVEIVDLFLDDGEIVRTEGRNSEPRSWAAKPQSTDVGLPLAILINRFSASASEITSAALQDHGRAVVIGSRSFGKGSVQNVIDLEGGEAALKLTTASYYRPSGKNIHRFPKAKASDEWGVRPSDGYEVDMPPSAMAKVRAANREIYEMRDEAPERPTDVMLDRAIETLTKEIDDQKAAATPAA